MHCINSWVFDIFGYVIYIYVYLGDEKEGWVNNLQSKVKREYISNGAAFQFR